MRTGLPHYNASPQRGSTLVEAALVAPVFFMLIFGILEFGFLFKDRLTTDNAARVGARSASVAGAADEADFIILQSVAHGLNTMDPSQINRVIIYKADNPDDPVPPLCLTSGSQSGPVDYCNSYQPAAFAQEFYASDGTENDYFGCVTATSADRFWCPGDRDVSLAAPPPDYVGVYVETSHAFITGFFGDGKTLSQTAVVRLEPEG